MRHKLLNYDYKFANQKPHAAVIVQFFFKLVVEWVMRVIFSPCLFISIR